MSVLGSSKHRRLLSLVHPPCRQPRRLSGQLFCVLVLGSKPLLLIGVLALAGCSRGVDGWQEVSIDVPGTSDDVTYLRKPLPNAWVGTEQYRRLRREDRVLELPVQMGGREQVNVYLRRDSSEAVLQFEESYGTTSVDLRTLTSWADTGKSDSLGAFVGALVSPEIRDLRFVPATEGDPIVFD